MPPTLSIPRAKKAYAACIFLAQRGGGKLKKGVDFGQPLYIGIYIKRVKAAAEMESF
jgi:hypothetical protein